MIYRYLKLNLSKPKFTPIWILLKQVPSFWLM